MRNWRAAAIFFPSHDKNVSSGGILSARRCLRTRIFFLYGLIHLILFHTCIDGFMLQCRKVKITIMGDEAVPAQVDGEAWMQPPGYIHIVHKNRAQMLTRDRVCTEP